MDHLQKKVEAKRAKFRGIETKLSEHYGEDRALSEEERKRLTERLAELRSEVIALYTEIVKKEAEQELSDNKRAKVAYDGPQFGSGRMLSRTAQQNSRLTQFRGCSNPKYQF